MSPSDKSGEAPAGGLYIYAVATACGPREYGAIGLEGATVSRFDVGDLAAIVSRIGKQRVRPERRNLSAHMVVTRRLMEDETVLPVSFGVIAGDDDALRTLLDRNAPLLVEQLEHVRGKVEMGLRVIWDVANVFEYFVNLRPELRAARDTVGDIRQASRDQMIALGQLFEHALNEERDRLYEQVDAALEAHGIERRRGKTRNEREVMFVACLVERDALGDFDRVIGEIASGFDSNFTFDLNGPWAPASFTEVALEI